MVGPTSRKKGDLKFVKLILLSEVEQRIRGSRPRPRTQKNFEAKAKDRPSRGQGQTKDTGAGVLQTKRRSSKVFFKRSQEKGLQKFFFRRLLLEENKKRSSQIFCDVSGAFQQNFNGSKNSAVLEPRTGQFSRT